MYQRLKTAFKHPSCGGVIYIYRWPTRTKYKCERCDAWGDDLVSMSLGLMDRPRPALPDSLVKDRSDQDQIKDAGG